MDRRLMSLLPVVLALTACGGSGGSGAAGGGDESGDIIDRLVTHFNQSKDVQITGGIYEIDAYSDPDYIGSQPGCFNFPAITRENFIDDRSVTSQSANKVCFDDQRCYTLIDGAVLSSTEGMLDEYMFDVLAANAGHVKALTRIIDDVPRAYFYLDIFESVAGESVGSCGYSPEDFSLGGAQFDTLNGEYKGRIYSVSSEDSLTPQQSEEISLFCSNDTCALGSDTLLLAETSSNTYRTNAYGADYLTGEFVSTEGGLTYTFQGGASYFGNVIAGIAYLDDGETPPACSEEKDCLLLVFSRQ